MGAIAQTKIRIDDNVFTGNPTTPTSASVAIEVVGAFRGVVDSNTFNGYETPNRAWGTGTGLTDWTTFGPYQFGSSDTMYFEDNTYTNIGGYSISDCAQGGRYAYRYNTITTTAANDPSWDYHGGNAGSSLYGCFGGELYGNLINGSSAYNVKLVAQRGAHELGFYNNITASASLYGIKLYTDGCPPTTNYSDQLIHDSYYWNSRLTATGSLLSDYIVEDLCGTTTPSSAIVANVIALGVTPSYWAQEPTGTFDGTGNTGGGVGCGTLANRPPTCTAGVGYWATNQSCSDLTGMVGANPSTPIDGTLYKCNASGQWEEYYKPYTYPHPLRVDGIGISDSRSSRCFIATAAYGSYLDPHVYILRNFRDHYLLTNYFGKKFVEFYYRNSPPIAKVIAANDFLKTATRWALTPIVYSVEYPNLSLALLLWFISLALI